MDRPQSDSLRGCLGLALVLLALGVVAELLKKLLGS